VVARGLLGEAEGAPHHPLVDGGERHWASIRYRR
jgi:hypothetical protein